MNPKRMFIKCLVALQVPINYKQLELPDYSYFLHTKKKVKLLQNVFFFKNIYIFTYNWRTCFQIAFFHSLISNFFHSLKNVISLCKIYYWIQRKYIFKTLFGTSTYWKYIVRHVMLWLWRHAFNHSSRIWCRQIYFKRDQFTTLNWITLQFCFKTINTFLHCNNSNEGITIEYWM